MPARCKTVPEPSQNCHRTVTNLSFFVCRLVVTSWLCVAAEARRCRGRLPWSSHCVSTTSSSSSMESRNNTTEIITATTSIGKQQTTTTSTSPLLATHTLGLLLVLLLLMMMMVMATQTPSAHTWRRSSATRHHHRRRRQWRQPNVIRRSRSSSPCRRRRWTKTVDKMTLPPPARTAADGRWRPAVASLTWQYNWLPTAHRDSISHAQWYWTLVYTLDSG